MDSAGQGYNTKPSAERTVEHEFDKIRSIVTVLWEIYHAWLAGCQFEVVTKITHQQVGNNTIYTLHQTEPDPTFAKGPELPKDTSPCVVRAVMNFNTCDTAANMMKEPLSAQMENIEAKVEWSVADFVPDFILHWNRESFNPGKDKVRHSILRVTCPTGTVYVVDFSIEQFGCDKLFSCVPEDVYCAQLGTGPFQMCSEAHQRPIREAFQQSGFRHESWTMQKIQQYAASINWKSLINVEETARLAKIGAEARAIFDEYESEEELYD